ncbi:MAG: phosphate ABC transporter substrate-binding protein [Proteobacteria bacterium]|nr:phosphate ABC transporter substrate-binding protein [Pseudomonadota bacterium]
MKKLFQVLLSFWVLALPSFGSASVDVVVNNDSGITSLSADVVKDLWTANSKTLGDAKAEMCDQAQDSAVRAEFYSKATGKTVREMLALWSKVVFTGRGSEPRVGANDAAVLECVNSSKGGIGYLPSGKADKSVRVVLKLP